MKGIKVTTRGYLVMAVTSGIAVAILLRDFDWYTTF
jgi:hypothetical protein